MLIKRQVILHQKTRKLGSDVHTFSCLASGSGWQKMSWLRPVSGAYSFVKWLICKIVTDCMFLSVQ